MMIECTTLQRLIHYFNKPSLFFFLFLSIFLLITGVSNASEISAKAAVLVDSTSGIILYAKNPDVKLQPASTAKLVTAMVVLDTLEPDTVVTVSQRAASVSSVEPKLHVGQKLSVKELLYLALMRSVNGAAVALAEAAAGSEKAFVNMMNKKVHALNTMNTKFINASGLPGKNQYTTARDLAEIMKESLKYPLIEEIISTGVRMFETENRPFLVKNTNHMLWIDDGQIGGKTGYTRAARHCFVGASRKGDRTLIVALLGEKVRNKLWQDARILFEKGLKMSSNIKGILRSQT